MSYCVNCGVELADTEKACPLCFVEVINPKNPYNPDFERHYPNIPVAGVVSHHRDLILPVGMVMLIPVFICVTCDLLTTRRLSWSPFVVASLALLSGFLLPPLAMSLTRSKVMACLGIDWVVLFFFLLALDRMTPGRWFAPVALPFLAVAGLVSFGLASLLLYVVSHRLVRIALTFFAIGLLSLCCDFLIKQNASENFQFPVGWSLFVLVPCLLIGVLLIVINHNQRLKEDMRQRFFV